MPRRAAFTLVLQAVFLKLWDIAGGKPSLVATNNPQIGAVFSAGFAPSSAWGARGAGPPVWDILGDAAVAEGPYGARLEKFNRAAALRRREGREMSDYKRVPRCAPSRVCMYEMNLITDIFDIIRLEEPFFIGFGTIPNEDYYYSIVYVDELL